MNWYFGYVTSDHVLKGPLRHTAFFFFSKKPFTNQLQTAFSKTPPLFQHGTASLL